MTYDASVKDRKGCNYCQNNKTITGLKMPLIEVSIENNDLVVCTMLGVAGVKLNYCPICGKRLRKELE